ncbi:MAG: hypothetical protein HN726_01085 [Candidatus Magasanikbacteria bacterium]|jgi:hypothetical protein|nr:hypothetical protein [Candidatus Magasanikbacteria bacterium]MBT4220777.1 hypothetical protein [Candidatus Magasanikbacteria bacterium]MBT4350122.1 hypothetical protein [Candidatus Magasanikbacteria bacterium]MBT4541435.1 hypothetical protein [Candidatus Magasanikbacteria bacterium]MBT6253125.1 hypothetical protein [Candidatus Magasanikbacteria bacterium]
MISFLKNIIITILIILIGIKIFFIINDVILAYKGKKIQALENQVEIIHDNPQALQTFIANHPATQERHIFASSKIKAYTYLSQFFLNQKNAEQCIKYTKELISFWNQNYEYFTLLGDCYLLIPDTKKAYEAYFNAWNIQPKNTYLTNQLIKITEKKGDIKQASYIKNISATYPETDTSIQFYLADKAHIFSTQSTQKPIYAPINNTFHKKRLIIKSHPDIVNPPKYIYLSPFENPGTGTTFTIASIVLHLENEEIITFKSFDEWEPRNLTRTPTAFIIDGVSPHLRSPSMKLSSKIESIEIDISFKPREH